MPWVYFEGGQRDGQLEEYGEDLSNIEYLVFDGPDWYGVYERSAGNRFRLTKGEPAQVWSSLG